MRRLGRRCAGSSIPDLRSGDASGVPRTRRTGQMPAQWSSERSSGSSTGGPRRIFAETSHERQDHDGGLAQLGLGRAADAARAPGHQFLDQGFEDRLFDRGVAHQAGRPVHDHGPVVRRVVEGGAGEHKGVQHRGFERDLDAFAAGSDPRQLGASRGVDEHLGTDAHEEHRQHLGAIVSHEGDVTEDRLVEDRVHRVGVVARPVGVA